MDVMLIDTGEQSHAARRFDVAPVDSERVQEVSGPASFEAALVEKINQAHRIIAPRIDDWRFSPAEIAWLQSSPPSAEFLAFIEAHKTELDVVWRLLSDAESRQVFVDVVAYRYLGASLSKLPLDTPEYWALRDQVIATTRVEKTNIDVGLGGDLAWFELKSLVPAWARDQNRPEPIRLLAHPANIMATFTLQQYSLQRPSGVVTARPGDIVIDAGGCWGDTALFFSNLVGVTPAGGEAGQVHVFEFDEANLKTMEANCEQNPRLAENITLVCGALWNQSGESISYDPHGAGSSLLANSGSVEVTTVTIDDYAAQAGLPRIDLIKMDIEGAETAALEGAVESIRRHKPVLAISIYHRPEDLYVIPQWINDLGLGYRLYVDHFTTFSEETVLFAVPPGRSVRPAESF